MSMAGAALTPYCRIADLDRTAGCKSVSEIGRGVGGLLDRPVVIPRDVEERLPRPQPRADGEMT